MTYTESQKRLANIQLQMTQDFNKHFDLDEALNKQNSSAKWLSIDTAPKKGCFLVKFNDYGEEYICSCFRNISGDFEFNGLNSVSCNNPIAWMPIPGESDVD